MEKEFNLSEKIISNIQETEWTNEGEDSEPIRWKNFPSVKIDDVKEFIRRLKEEFKPKSDFELVDAVLIIETIDNLAGYELK